MLAAGTSLLADARAATGPLHRRDDTVPAHKLTLLAGQRSPLQIPMKEMS
jgi:hypothetical protein